MIATALSLFMPVFMMVAFAPWTLMAAPGVPLGAPPVVPIIAQDLRTGTVVKIEFDKAPKATVLIFLSTLCPCSQNHEPRLMEIVQEFGQGEFQFVGVHSNRFLPRAQAMQHFEEVKLPFPVLDDVSLEVANRFEAQATPHAFVVGRNGEVLFRGGVDSSHDPYERDSEVKIKLKDGHSVLKSGLKNFLVNALSAIRTGSDRYEKSPRVVGCIIDRP